MDEDSGVKAPVTRLRRRLSTDAEGTQSPLTPSTPTKKRSTRLAAKPALELIDENKSTPVKEAASKRGTGKAATKDEGPEEAPHTPSRRSTRIRSNTSLVLEAVQHSVTDSPRAKRAARRASHLESDSESSTPARQTRRTRNNSTSSVEKLAVTNSNEKAVAQVAEAIVEEPEKETKNDASKTVTPTRKSPRLSNKGKKTEDETEKDMTDSSKQNTKIIINEVSSSTNELTTTEENKNNQSKLQDSANLSQDSAKLIDEIDSNPVKSKRGNKTICAIEEFSNDKSNKKVNKSWTSITTEDTLAGKIDINKFTFGNALANKADMKPSNNSVTIFNTSMENKENIQISKAAEKDAEDIVNILKRTPVKNIQSVIYMEDSDSNSNSAKLPIDTHNDIQRTDSDDQCVPVVKNGSPKRLASESCAVEPMDIDDTIPENVTINDFSDKSNTSDDTEDGKTTNNKSVNKSRSSISQQQELNSSSQKPATGSEDMKNKSVNSMVTGESQRKSSISLLNESDKNINENNDSNRNSSLSKTETDINDRRKLSISTQASENLNDSTNKSKRISILETENINSKRKSSANSDIEEQQNENSNKSQNKVIPKTETLNTSNNENKSTLVLSQLKDVSANDIHNAGKSPYNSNDLSKTDLAKETDKKNSALDSYLTSTPLQQKSMQKLAMQINTSSISPNTEIKNTSKVNKTKTPVKNMLKVESDSDSSSEEESRDKSKMVEDEAEEASDDYESGDSRDGEERKYEEENAIPEKGETLESEQNFSTDSDYEKDSFVVSSDEEDEELLSGSGDDLSLSDNELKMTAKSKKKFDDRKRKEQKKASREMYNARHKLNESCKKSSKTKFNVESSDSESEDDYQPKTKVRQRIDSSKDNDEIDANLSIKKKKKTKRLSESVCEDNATEMEITISSQSVTEKKDPLVSAIKQEPKTPQKDLNMSVAFIKDNIEEVQVDNNVSVFQPNEATDPLQATTAQDDEESDSDMSNLSLFSLENHPITNNYDSVLANLNKANGKQNQLKLQDTSLNLNKSKKNKPKDPIVDQLNLTQTKKSKKNKIPKSSDKAAEEPKPNNEVSVIMAKTNAEADNSDSIDMRLLFSEDSNDSEVHKSKFKADKQDSTEKFIPLKESKAKTNIRENIDEPEDNVPFFIDTQGDYGPTDTSTKINKKKKKHKASLSELNVSETNNTNTSVVEENVTNVSIKSDKKKNKKSLDGCQINNNAEPDQIQINLSVDTEKKKKKNKSLLDTSQVAEKTEPEETPANISINSAKKKKNRSHLEISEITENSASEEPPVNVSMSSDKKNKKKKNKSQLDFSEITDNTVTDDTTANISLYSDNKKKNKNRSLLDVSQIAVNEVSEEAPANISLGSEKKKKKNKTALDISLHKEDTVPQEPTVVVSSAEKKKKNKSLSEDNEVAERVNNTETVHSLEYLKSNPEAVEECNVSLNSEKKKRKKNKSTSEMSDDAVAEKTPANASLSSDKKKKEKKKNKARTDESQTNDNTEADELHSARNDEAAGEVSDDAPEEVAYTRVKKSDNPDQEEEETASLKSKNKFKKKKKKKSVLPKQGITETDVKAVKRKLDENTNAAYTVSDVFQMSKNKKKKFAETEDDDGTNTQGKKRKHTEDDAVQKNSKAFKGNFFEKIHVPRLPDSVVSQLDDQPKQFKKEKLLGMAIATVPFIVEEGPKRKNKPSNYLEQSIYLNDYVSPQKKNQKAFKKVPKVLPFTPTAITSEEGYTSNFRINVLPKHTEFIAEASTTNNFKERLLSKQRLTKLKVERYKRVNNYKNKF